MAKTKKTREQETGRRAFQVKSEMELSTMSEAERRAYQKRLNRHKQQQAKKEAMVAAGEKLEARLELLESALKTKVSRKGDISCDLIDATFASPCKRTMFATEGLIVRFFDEGDLIQINCHTVPKTKVPCVVVQNGKFYFAQKVDDNTLSYVNLDSSSTDAERELLITEEEYVGEIVNVIQKPQDLLPKEDA